MESGNIETTGETPSFVLPLSDGDVCHGLRRRAGRPHATAAGVVIRKISHSCCLNPERNQDIKFSAVINDDDSADPPVYAPLRERVRITRNSQGTPQAEHLPELQNPVCPLPKATGRMYSVDVTWVKAMDKAFIRVDETFEAIRDSLNQQAINNIARKLALGFYAAPSRRASGHRKRRTGPHGHHADAA